MKRRTVKFTLDNEIVFRLEVQGSDAIVEKLTDDVWFNGALRVAAEELIKHKVAEKLLKTVKPIIKEGKNGR